MKLISTKILAAGLLVTAVAGIASLIVPGLIRHNPPPSVIEMIGHAQPAEQIKLYPSTPGQSLDTASDYLKAIGLNSRPFSRQNKVDGGTVDVFYRADHTREFTLEFFFAPTGRAKSLKAATRYQFDGDKIAEEVAFSPAGKRLFRGLRLANGNYQTFAYFADGITKESLSIVGQGFEDWDKTPRLLSETRWRLDGTVAYTNVLNADNSRTILAFDEHGVQTEVSHFAYSINGSTVLAHYPGSAQIRLESTSDYWATKARFYRLDGTLEMTAEISSSSIEFVTYDTTGKIMLLERIWNFKRVEENGVVLMKDLRISQIVEPDALGQPARQWWWSVAGGIIWSYQEYNTVVEGKPPIHVKRILNFFRDTDGSLDRTDYQPVDPSMKEWSVHHTPEENIRPPQPSPADMVIPKLNDILPVPYPQTGH